MKAHEITTVFSVRGKNYMGKYIVVASSISNALRLLGLKDGEEVLKATSLTHKVIVEGEKTCQQLSV